MIEFQNNYLQRIEEARVVERRIDVRSSDGLGCSYHLLIQRRNTKTMMVNLKFTA